MRKSLILAALAVAVLSACGPSKTKYFKVAVDDTNLRKISPATMASCYAPGTSTDVRNTTTTESIVKELEIGIWDGTDGKVYLELPAAGISQTLGDSPTITFTGMVAGTAKDSTFLARRTEESVPPVFKIKNTTTTSMKIVFKDLGDTTTGTIDFASSYSCTPNPDGKCPDPQPGAKMMPCAAQVPFVAHRVEVVEQNTFGN